MDWQDLEAKTRIVASYIWQVPAVPENINGVKVDCVLKIKSNYWVLIEITQTASLEKLRTDIAKFAAVRPYLFSQDVYAECYFVCERDVPPSLIDTGKGNHVEVLSFHDFEQKLLSYDQYYYARSRKKFGSAVDPFSGEKDGKQYIPVTYEGVSTRKEYDIDDIANQLLQGRRFVLLGNYGTGKSRCMQELFRCLHELSQGGIIYPMSIDLRDNWGVQRAYEIIRRHLDSLGLCTWSDNVLKVLGSGHMLFLLDGFDEIGSQTWSDDPARLKSIRFASLAGVRDLIQNAAGGLIVTGREHYFNSKDEMFSCLGLKEGSTTLVRCLEEFTYPQMEAYIKGISTSMEVPLWLPRRPLVCQIVSILDPDRLENVLSSADGELEFWATLLEAVCAREAQINPSLDPLTIRRVLARIARFTRAKPGDVGPISIIEINKAFEEVVGFPAVDESAIMLQRLPTLGRIGSESTDRQFMDYYILDGLRAEDLIGVVDSQEESAKFQPWKNPLRPFGLRLVAQDILSGHKLSAYIRQMKQAAAGYNHILAADIIAAVLMAGQKDHNFDNLAIADSHFAYLDLSATQIKSLTIQHSVIEELDISEAHPQGVVIEDCIIQKIVGVSDAEGLPSWIMRNAIELFESVSTVARIRKANLTDAQRVFTTIVKKTFFQRGGGRKEEALLRGLGSLPDKRIAEKIVSRLVSHGILSKHKGKEGWVYSPNRSETKRMGDILSHLTLSQDPLWTDLDDL